MLAHAIRLAAKRRYSAALKVAALIGEDNNEFAQAQEYSIELCRLSLSVDEQETSRAIRRTLPHILRLLSICAGDPRKLRLRLAVENLFSGGIAQSVAQVVLAATLASMVRTQLQLFSDCAQKWGSSEALGKYDRVQAAIGAEQLFETTLQLAPSGTYVIGVPPLPQEAMPFTTQETLMELRRSLEEEDDPEMPNEKLLEYYLWTIHLLVRGSEVVGVIDLDFSGLHFLIQKFALKGLHQEARNLAETGLLHLTLHQTEARQLRIVLAWICMAEGFSRSGQAIRAALHLCFAASAGRPRYPVTLDWCNIWCRLAARTLRDLRLFDGVDGFIHLQRAIVEKGGKTGRYKHQIDVLELSVELLKDTGNPVRLTRHLETALRLLAAAPEEELPLITMSASALRICDAAGVTLPPEIRQALVDRIERLPIQQRAQLVGLVSQRITKEELTSSATASGWALFPEDLGPQMLPTIVTCLRALSQATTEADAELFFAAFNLQCQPSLSFSSSINLRPRQSDTEWRNRLLAEPRDVAALSTLYIKSNLHYSQRHDLSAVMQMTIDQLKATLSAEECVMLLHKDEGHKLSRLLIRSGHALRPEAVPASMWNPTSYPDWRLVYPDRYGDWVPSIPFQEGIVDNSEVEQSLVGRMLGTIPDIGHLIIIPGPQLFSFPFNLLQIEQGAFWLEKNALSVCPSPSWLINVRGRGRSRSLRSGAWLGGPTGNLSLQITRSVLKPMLKSYGVEEIYSESPSGNLIGTDLAVALCHGGTGLLGQFNSVDNDILDRSLEDFASEFENCGCVVLLICNAGAAHQRETTPESIGLVPSILRRGASSVVACPWSLRIDLVEPWLRPFLESAFSGKPISDAAAKAARHLKTLHSNAAAWSVMHVYGDGGYRIV